MDCSTPGFPVHHNYAEGAEAEEAGMSAEHVSTREPENFTELQAAKETSGP